MTDNDTLRALVAKWRGLASDGLRYSGSWSGESMCARIEWMADELEAALAAMGGEAQEDDELPGMWSRSDFTGGDPDERSYAERGAARKVAGVTEAMVEAASKSLCKRHGCTEPCEFHARAAADALTAAHQQQGEGSNG